MIDLHSHTIYSDGSASVEEILTEAAKKSLTYFSITDHNTVAAYRDEAVGRLSTLYPGTLVRGVEITCMFRGEVVEILGYGYDLQQMERELPLHVLTFEEKQLLEFDLICQTFDQVGVRYNREKIVFDPKVESSRKAFMRSMWQFEENLPLYSHPASVGDSQSFSRNEVYNPASKLYVDQSPLYPTAREAVEVIHRCGGLAFLAHLFIYSHAAEFRCDLAHIVKELSLDGIECAHSAFKPEQIANLEAFCDANGLLKSGGSDYHGTLRPEYALGAGQGRLVIPEAYIKAWTE